MTHPAASLLDSLTDEQGPPVHAIREGVSRVIAGPGTGKTRVLTARIARMVLDGVQPEEIRALVFTRTAAAEIRARLRHVIGERANDVGVMTFHAYAWRLIQQERAEEGLRPVFIATEAEEESFRASIHEGPLRLPNRRRVPKDRFDAAIGSRDAGSRCDVEAETSIGVLLSRFDGAGLIPTWDLLPTADGMLRDEHRVQHVLVDEAQDLTPREWSMVSRMWERSLFIVGDPHQAIMGWRGAVGFDCAPEGTTFTIRQSFRFGPEIAAIANRIIPEAQVLGVERERKPDVYRGRAVLRRTWFECEMFDCLDGEALTADWGPFIVDRRRVDARDEDPNDCAVYRVGWTPVITIHSAKGCEWDRVLIPGVMTLAADPEERRVQFVAVTRARLSCHVEIADGPSDGVDRGTGGNPGIRREDAEARGGAAGAGDVA